MVRIEVATKDPHQLVVRRLLFKGVGRSRGGEEDALGGLKKALAYSRLLSLTRNHEDLKLLVSRWKSHTFVV